jgi:hypothetical protein
MLVLLNMTSVSVTVSVTKSLVYHLSLVMLVLLNH